MLALYIFAAIVTGGAAGFCGFATLYGVNDVSAATPRLNRATALVITLLLTLAFAFSVAAIIEHGDKRPTGVLRLTP